MTDAYGLHFWDDDGPRVVTETVLSDEGTRPVRARADVTYDPTPAPAPRPTAADPRWLRAPPRAQVRLPTPARTVAAWTKVAETALLSATAVAITTVLTTGVWAMLTTMLVTAAVVTHLA